MNFLGIFRPHLRFIPHLKYMGKKVLPNVLKLPQNRSKKSEKIHGDFSYKNTSP